MKYRINPTQIGDTLERLLTNQSINQTMEYTRTWLENPKEGFGPPRECSVRARPYSYNIIYPIVSANEDGNGHRAYGYQGVFGGYELPDSRTMIKDLMGWKVGIEQEHSYLLKFHEKRALAEKALDGRARLDEKITELCGKAVLPTAVMVDLVILSGEDEGKKTGALYHPALTFPVSQLVNLQQTLRGSI